MILFTAGISVFSYLLFYELFKKKNIALITSIILVFQWVIFFYSFRILRDVPAAFFIIASPVLTVIWVILCSNRYRLSVFNFFLISIYS